MAQAGESLERQASQELLAHVVAQLRAGKSKEQICGELAQVGMDQLQAELLVTRVHTDLLRVADQEQTDPSSIVRGVVGALLAALVGGVFWGVIVILTEYEIGFMATGVGVLAGYAVLSIANRRGRHFQVMAVAASLIGILIGRYLSFYALVRDYATQEFGAQASARLSLLMPEVLQLFFASILDLASPYDLLWIALAVMAAWRIPKGIGWKPPRMI